MAAWSTSWWRPKARHPRCDLVALCLVGSTQAGTHTIEGDVVGITDGDAITLLDADNCQHTIRLDGIDAPEGKQPFGAASKRSLSRMAYNREAVAECSKTDRYGSDVRRVLVGGIDVCLEQLRAGMAWLFTRYANELQRGRSERYADMEARAERRGLCADREPVAPWE